MYVNTGGYDPKEVDLGTVLKVGHISRDIMMMEEDIQVSFTLQIHGLVTLLDFYFTDSWTCDTVGFYFTDSWTCDSVGFNFTD